VEKAIGNSIVVKALKNIHINLANGAKPKSIEVGKEAKVAEKPTIEITADGGSVEEGIKVTAVVKLSITKGDNATGSDAINVSVAIESTSAGVGGETTETVNISSEVKVDVNAKTVVDLNVELTKDAGGSSIKAEASSENYKVSVTNTAKSEAILTTVVDGEEKQTSVPTDGKAVDKDVTASANETVLAAVKEGLVDDKIKGDNPDLNTVTTALNLYNASDKYSGVATGASITWKSDNAALKIGVADENGLYATTITRDKDKNVSVILTATITVGEGKAAATGSKEFKITIPQDTTGEPEDKTVKIEWTSVSYTVVTGQTIEVTSGSAVSGSSITVDAKATVTVGGETTTPTLSYAFSESKPTDDNAYITDASKLQLATTDTNKKLWIKVTVEGVSDPQYFGSNETVNPNKNGTLTFPSSK